MVSSTDPFKYGSASTTGILLSTPSGTHQLGPSSSGFVDRRQLQPTVESPADDHERNTLAGKARWARLSDAAIPKPSTFDSGKRKPTKAKTDKVGDTTTAAIEMGAALEEELYNVYPKYVEWTKIEAAIRGEEKQLR